MGADNCFYTGDYKQHIQVFHFFGFRTALDWITNPYPHYYTYLKALAGEIHIHLPVTLGNLCYTGLQKAEEAAPP